MYLSKKQLISTSLAVTAGIVGVSVYANHQEPVSIVTILDTTKGWDNVSLPQNTRVNMKNFTIQPGATIPVHKHLVNGGGVILKGELTMFVTHDPNGSFDDPSVLEITLHEGDTWAETVDTWHYGVNRGSEPVNFIVTFIGDADTPQTKPFPSKK